MVSILVVEDDIDIVDMVSNAFDEAGYENVLHAYNADAALELLKQNTIDLLFTDLKMPGTIDGAKLAIAARERDANIKIIITSGNLFEFGWANLPSLGIVMQKPYSIAEVITVAKKLLEEN